MNIQEIKVCELLSFIESGEFKNLDPKPITELRAISQFHNPDAEPADTALLYISEGSDLIAFAGLLPKYINGKNLRVFSNSCWWAHPEKGKGAALPLFLKLIERANFNLYVSESTPRIKLILEKTGLFGPLEQKEGIRIFLRFYFADIFSRRYPKLKWLSGLPAVADGILNLIARPSRFFYLKKFKKNSLEVELVPAVDKELGTFIREHSEDEFIRKTPENFNWFKKHPWVTVERQGEKVNYPFTCLVNRFGLDYYVLKKEQAIKAFVAVSHHDNLAKIPFIYFEEENISEVAASVMSLILNKKYDSLIVFHPGIVEFMKSYKMLFLYKKKEIKFSGATKQVFEYFAARPKLQDGDGDVVFV